MKKLKEKLKYGKKGITLISLVVTIIVLLILAGVTIATLTGNNGILNRATEAKNKTEEAQEKEGIGLALSTAQIGDNGYQELNQTNLQKALDEQFGEGKSTVIDNKDKTFIVNFNESRRSYNITSSGEIKESEIKKASSILAEDYGAYVTNYIPKSTITSDIGWRIFHSDGTNVYLIADNYIETTDLPSSTKNGEETGNLPLVGNLVKTAAFTDNILEDYVGAESITSSYKWLKQYNSRTDIYNNINNNIKSTAYMLDTIAWSGFANDKAEYAVGAPTLELFVASYNVKHPDTLIYTQATSNVGYQIKGGPLAKEDYVDAMGLGSGTEDLWVIESRSEAYGMWLASPSNLNVDNNMYIYAQGYITSAEYYNEWLGFRPVICLKSDTKLIKHQNLTGTISYVIL